MLFSCTAVVVVQSRLKNEPNREMLKGKDCDECGSS